jgi:hypothetical protein
MYADHPLCNNPNPDTIIWRYLNTQKFESLLEKKALFFSKARYLKDLFEGRYPPSYKRKEGASFNRGGFNQMGFNQGANYLPDSKKDSTFICCFTMNEFENDAMWKSYLMNNEGVAIQSTFKQLQESFEETNDEMISIGIVKYYDNDFDGSTNVFKLFLQKRVFFNNENELRAIMIKFSDRREIIENGIFVPIKVKNLINKVILSPNSSEFFEKRIKSLCAQSGLDNIVYRSKLEEFPKW